jgi:hypothetical protein
MIRDLFNKDKPLFVGFDNDQFTIGKRRREHLQGTITDMIPMRKRFCGKQLVCTSSDGITGKHGQRCALCRDRWTCAERLRLMMLLDNLERTATPAILEIGHGSFDALDAFIDQIGTDPLPKVTVSIGMEHPQGRLRFTFHKAE